MIKTKLDDDGIARVSLNRVDAKNAVSTAMWAALDGALTQLDDRPRALVLASSLPTIFCPGADIKEFPKLMESAETRTAMRTNMQRCVNRLERLPYPTIAAINGACVGAGVSIAAACDLRVASETARFGITPAKLGVLYSKDDIRRLINIIGIAAAKDLLFTGRLMDAREAQGMQLVTTITAQDTVLEDAMALARSIASNSSTTHLSVKTILHALQGNAPFDDAAHNQEFEEAFVQEDTKARIEKMLVILSKK